MMDETASQFVARALDLLPFPPPGEPATDARCWLCGGFTSGGGWRRDDCFPDTFTNVNLASVASSRTVCQGCAAVSRGESWALHAARYPDLELVTKHPISWRSYGHAVWEGGFEHPKPARWRELLVEPPDPPFVFALPESKQKHLLFRCRIAFDRDRYPLQLEKDSLLIERANLARSLEAFERLLALGCRRGEILTGAYHPESIKRAGMTVWRAAEDRMVWWRRHSPELVRLAGIVARGPTKEED